MERTVRVVIILPESCRSREDNVSCRLQSHFTKETNLRRKTEESPYLPTTTYTHTHSGTMLAESVFRCFSSCRMVNKILLKNDKEGTKEEDSFPLHSLLYKAEALKHLFFCCCSFQCRGHM